MQRGFVNKVFTQLVESLPSLPGKRDSIPTEGIVTSLNEFFSLLYQANENYSKTFNITDDDKLVFTDEFPHELLVRLNDETNFQKVYDEATQKKIRVVTVLANERPATLSAHRVDEDGIRNIKERLIDVIPDTKYSGYSILRYGRDLEATVNFKVWGLNVVDMRKRAEMLRKIIDLNSWYFKHKGLRDIVWLGSNEWGEWDGAQIVKAKSEKYLIRYTSIREVREKNIEQVIIQMGIDNSPVTTSLGEEFFTPE